MGHDPAPVPSQAVSLHHHLGTGKRCNSRKDDRSQMQLHVRYTLGKVIPIFSLVANR